MFGAVLRAAGGFAGAMVVATLLAEVVQPLANFAKPVLGQQSQIIVALTESVYWFPFLALLGILAGLVARGAIEQGLPRGG